MASNTRSKAPTKNTQEHEEGNQSINLNLVKELLKVQESTILSFFTSLNDTTNRRIDNLVKDVQDLKNSIEFTQAEVADLRDLRLQIQIDEIQGGLNP